MSDNSLTDVLDGVDIENTTVEERSYEPLPAGDYLVQATEGAVVRKDNGNAMIKLTFEIMDGEYERRKLFENLNIRHSNPTTQRIATERLTQFWRDALGQHGNPPNVDDLLFRPVVVTVVVKADKADPKVLRNNIVKIRSASGDAPPKQEARPAAAPAARSAPAASGNRPSWLKKSA